MAYTLYVHSSDSLVAYCMYVCTYIQSYMYILYVPEHSCGGYFLLQYVYWSHCIAVQLLDFPSNVKSPPQGSGY
jgi:hypothetical protein